MFGIQSYAQLEDIYAR
ncbi:hypothetical protein ACJ8CT_04740 [Klebsiella pneumoniae]